MKWYVALTKPRQEFTASLGLKQRGYETYLPVARQDGRLSPLFPSYLFVHLDTQRGDWSEIHSTRGVRKLIRFGSLPTPIQENKLALVREMEDGEGIIDLDQELKPGDRVEIKEGIFQLYEAIVSESSGDHVKIILWLMNRQTEITMDRQNLNKLDD